MERNYSLYPLKFQPIYKYRIWGGEKLKTQLNKKYDAQNIGESWEISDVKNDETKVINGTLRGYTLIELIEKFKVNFLGKTVYKKFGNQFPLLIKFIDAKTPLSIQVHPSDKIAKERHNSFGKNEMWYVMQADENAELIVGFDKKIPTEDYNNHLANNTILEIMHHEKVSEGDTFYIPTGRVHAIGAGVLLAEIQQTSNITYRIYDYDRVDVKTGEKRELHNDLAIDVIDFQIKDSYKTKYTKECERREEQNRTKRSKDEYWDNFDLEAFIYDEEGLQPKNYDSFIQILRGDFLQEQQEENSGDFHEQYRFQEYKCFSKNKSYEDTEENSLYQL
ncbi:MAG: class I mannose-6-phosphate isomerase [Flavobacteriaceae bacterium]|nr:class I mannose-6-phosphate isomerase [Flavobacteriaceae bacterium]